MTHAVPSVLVALSLSLTACSPTDAEQAGKEHVIASMTAVRREIQVFTATPPPSIEVLDILLDASPGSPGSDKTLVRPSVAAIASVVSGHSGSIVRFWLVGDDASRTSIAATIVITSPKASGRSAVQAHEANEVRRILAAFDSLAIVTPKRSPIFSSVVRVAQESAPGESRRVIMLVSDLLEHAELGDLECDDPVPSSWKARLTSARLFLPASLRSVTIIAIQTGLRPVANRRCPATIAHHDRVFDLWTRTVRESGATFTSATGTLTSEQATALLNKEQAK
ncbi:MAG TPA: hypothetical protein VGN17_04945 [Bryobacteraceae bacterium]|jgi:hypothetical protein